MAYLSSLEAVTNTNRWAKPIFRIGVCTVTMLAVVLALSAIHVPPDRSLSAALNLFLILVLVASIRWGTRYAIFVSLLSTLGFSWTLRPLGHSQFNDARIWTLFMACLATGVVAGRLSGRARRSEKQLRDVIETIPAMAFSIRPDGSTGFVNGRLLDYTGLSADTISGPGWQSTLHADDFESHMKRWRESMASGEPFENEARHRNARGEYRWFLVRAVPLRDEQGNILNWYGILTDIEDRKRAEMERERLRQLESDLAHMNRVSMMGELSASLGHEIKQPIAAAAMNAKTSLRWLQREPPEIGEAREAIARIVKDVVRAAEIVERNRALFRRDAPKVENIALNGLVREMIALLHGAAKRRSVSIRAELEETLPTSLGDRVQMQQVLMNLMLNGIEAMQDTGGELTITAKKTEEGEILLSVRDVGIGLPAQKTEYIFDAFFTTKAQGTGMGLSICRRIVESHGGRLWASANTGPGATFHFTLPTAASTSSSAAAVY
jgi:PAS domain S-box-containing protein